MAGGAELPWGEPPAVAGVPALAAGPVRHLCSAPHFPVLPKRCAGNRNGCPRNRYISYSPPSGMSEVPVPNQVQDAFKSSAAKCEAQVVLVGLSVAILLSQAACIDAIHSLLGVDYQAIVANTLVLRSVMCTTVQAMQTCKEAYTCNKCQQALERHMSICICYTCWSL